MSTGKLIAACCLFLEWHQMAQKVMCKKHFSIRTEGMEKPHRCFTSSGKNDWEIMQWPSQSLWLHWIKIKFLLAVCRPLMQTVHLVKMLSKSPVKSREFLIRCCLPFIRNEWYILQIIAKQVYLYLKNRLKYNWLSWLWKGNPRIASQYKWSFRNIFLCYKKKNKTMHVGHEVVKK